MLAALVSSSAWTVPAIAETINGALAKAYDNNASLNLARAGVRVTNESVPLARSGLRPIVAGQGQLNYQTQSGTEILTGSFGVSIQQPIFDGFQTRNNVEAAEARVRASRESLRNTEQNILFNAASAYMDVIRDRQIAVFQERNLAFLTEQVRASDARFDVGEGTRTDVALAQAQRASAIAQLSAARATAQASAALYRQIVGEDPGRLSPANPPMALLPGGLDAAFVLAAAQHPTILATQHMVDAAGFDVKVAEGALLPSLGASAGVTTTYTDRSGGVSAGGAVGLPGVGLGGGSSTSTSANVGLNLTVPIYQGGRASGQVRLSKEQLGQARIEVDVQRDQVRQAVASAWAQYDAARQSVSAIRETVSAANLALAGVNEERNVGQRTQLDVLIAQSDVIASQINLVNAERDVVVAGYAILSATGRLTAANLGLPVQLHRPEEHYEAVRDRWGGTRTPDGR